MATSETAAMGDGDDRCESKEPALAAAARRPLLLLLICATEHADESLLQLQRSSSSEKSKRRARWPEGILEDASRERKPLFFFPRTVKLRPLLRKAKARWKSHLAVQQQ